MIKVRSAVTGQPLFEVLIGEGEFALKPNQARELLEFLSTHPLGDLAAIRRGSGSAIPAECMLGGAIPPLVSKETFNE